MKLRKSTKTWQKTPETESSSP